MPRLTFAMIANNEHVRQLVEISVTAEQDLDLPDETWENAPTVEEIDDRLSRYGAWGWAVITVKIKLGPLEGTASMCGCSYEDELDFMRSSPYVDDLHKDALADLNVKILEMESMLRCLDTAASLENQDRKGA